MFFRPASSDDVRNVKPRRKPRLARRTCPLNLEVLEERLAPAAGPVVIDFRPIGVSSNSKFHAPVSQASIKFDRVIDPATFTPADVVSFSGPSGAITVTGVTPTAGGSNKNFTLSFANQGKAGAYAIVLGPDIRDTLNQPMDQNNNNITGETPGDQFSGGFTVYGPVFNSRNVEPTASAPPGTVDRMRIVFNPSPSGIDAATFTAADFLSFTGPNGPVTITSITPVPTRPTTEFFVEFAPQGKAGTYNFTIGADIQDPFGNLIDQNQNQIGGETPGDSFVSSFTIAPFTANSTITVPGTPSGPVSNVRIGFNRAVDLSTLATTDVTVTGPGGPITVTSITPVAGSGDRQFDVNFAPQMTLGTYTVVIGPTIFDVYANGMDQDQDGTPFEVPADQLTRTFTIEGPWITSITNSGTLLPGISSATVTFSQPMDPATFTTADVLLTGPNGNVPITSITPVAGSNNQSFTIAFPVQGKFGTYQWTIGPDIRNPAGMAMDQDGNDIAGEIPADQFRPTFNITAPRINSSTPSGTLSAPPSKVTLGFTQDMDGSSFTTADIVSFTGPDGNVTITGINQVSARKFDITFTPSNTFGNYALVLGPNILDTFGNPMNQNSNTVAGEDPADRFSLNFSYNNFGPEPFYGYFAQPTPFQNIDLEMGQSGVFTIQSNLNTPSTSVDLGANAFNFYGQVFTGANRLFVSWNGLISFGVGDGSFPPSNPSPLSSFEPLIAVLWRNYLAVATSGAILGKFEDTNSDGTPERLIIEWSNLRSFLFFDGQPLTFQAILDLNSGPATSGITLNWVSAFTFLPGVDNGNMPANIKPGGLTSFPLTIPTAATNSPFVNNGRALRFAAPSSGGEIRGVKFNDLDRDGVRDPDEPGLANWQVFLDQNGNGTFDAGEPTQFTDGDGNYAFTNLAPGNYVVAEVVQPGWVQSRPGVGGTISNGSFETGDFTDWATTGAASIQGTFGVAPTQGSKQALLSTAGSVPSAAALETFLEVTPGTLTTIGGAPATRGSAIKRTIFATAGSSLTFDYDFLTNETRLAVVDAVFVTVAPSSGASVRNNFSFSKEGISSATGFVLQSGYGTFSYVFTETGTYTVGIGVVEGFDAVGPSAVLVDNFRLLGTAYPVGLAARQVITGRDFGNFQLPVAVDDGFSTNEDEALIVAPPGFLGNDTTYLPGGSLSTVLVDGPDHGLLILAADGSFQYTPDDDYSGIDIFQYMANDGFNSNVATVTITIVPVADAPNLIVQNATGTENAAIPLDIAAALNDLDGSETLAVRIDGIPADATLSAGTNLGGGSWLLTAEELEGLTFTRLDNGTSTLTVTAIATEGGNGDVATTVADLTVTVNNVAPFASVTGPSGGVRGQSRTFTLGATDPSPTDQAAGFTFAIDWDGNGSTDQTVSGADGVQVKHIYTTTGTYTVKVTATDKDGGTSGIASQVMVITVVALQPDPGNPGLTALAIGGSTGSDVIQVTKSGANIQASLGGTTYGPFSPTGHIIVYAQAGNDIVQIHNNITLPTLVYGDAGNDVLQGGGGQNLLSGGTDTDVVQGGSLRDVILGGIGTDVLNGHGGDDLLIAGTTTHDGDDAALCAIMAEWGRGDRTYEQRVANLRSGGPDALNGSVLLTASTVFDDNMADVLTGGPGRDWFWGRQTGINADVMDRALDELLN